MSYSCSSMWWAAGPISTAGPPRPLNSGGVLASGPYHGELTHLHHHQDFGFAPYSHEVSNKSLLLNVFSYKYTQGWLRVAGKEPGQRWDWFACLYGSNGLLRNVVHCIKAAKSAHEEQVKAQKQKELEDAEAAQWADGAKDNKVSRRI
jgi:hypothetical protein